MVILLQLLDLVECILAVRIIVLIKSINVWI